MVMDEVDEFKAFPKDALAVPEEDFEVVHCWLMRRGRSVRTRMRASLMSILPDWSKGMIVEI